MLDSVSITALGKFPGEGNGNPLQYSCLENPMDLGAWQATIHGVAKEPDMTEQLNNNNSSRKTLTNNMNFKYIVRLTQNTKLFPGHFQPHESRASCCWWGLVLHHALSISFSLPTRSACCTIIEFFSAFCHHPVSYKRCLTFHYKYFLMFIAFIFHNNHAFIL